MGKDSSLLLENVYKYNNASNILQGFIYKTDDPFEKYYSSLIKISEQNKTVWSKSVSSLDIQIQKILILTDGKICVVISSKEMPGRINRYLLFLDTNGNIISCNEIRFKVPNTTIDDLSVYSTADDKLILIARFDYNNVATGGTQQWFVVAKCNSSCVFDWSHAYQSCCNNYGMSGCAIANNNFFIWSGVWGKQQDNSNVEGIQIFKFDLLTGNLIKSKTCGIGGGFNIFSSAPKSGYILNSFFDSKAQKITCFLPSAYYYTDTNHVLFQFDTALNVLQSKFINYTGKRELMHTRQIFDSNGNLFISAAKKTNNKIVDIFHIDSNLNLVEQKEYVFTNNTISSFPFWSYYGPQLTLKENSYSIYNNVIQGKQFQIEIAESNFNSIETNCNGRDIDSITISDFKFSDGNLIFNYEKSNVTDVRPASITLLDMNIKTTVSCFTVIERKFDCGKDLSICQGDTVQIKASGNFLNYNWPVSYNTKQINDSISIVFPEKDTFYIARAKTGAGCELFDTVFVKVKQGAKINLGNDTSICKTDSVVFNAGAGFLTYEWNTGETTQKIYVKATGIYSVKALNNNGCYSSDSVIIKNQFTLPDIHLKKDSILCLNQSDTLEAGENYKSYLWQDNSRKPYIKVVEPGLYSVKVTDINGCIATDSVVIKRVENPPANFVTSDTTLCSYQTIEIKPTSRDYIFYLWSTGSTIPILQINKPGRYSLTVTSPFGCTGTEIINVLPKICINKITFPNAFTPDNNGLNDIFKPVIEGSVQFYTLSIYDNWGNCVFKTTNTYTGWNGLYKGNLQPTGCYTWSCKIQFYGEPMQNKKGLLFLIY